MATHGVTTKFKGLSRTMDEHTISIVTNAEFLTRTNQFKPFYGQTILISRIAAIENLIRIFIGLSATCKREHARESEEEIPHNQGLTGNFERQDNKSESSVGT